MTQGIKVDPRTKLVIVLCLSSLAVFMQNIMYLAVVLLISLVIVMIFKVNLRQIFNRLKGLIYVLIGIALIQSIFSKGGQALFTIGGINIITVTGLQKGLEFILRIVTVICSAAIITTSSSREIVQGLVQWKLPYEIAFMVSLGIRFLPILMEEIRDSLVAIQLRGVEVDRIPWKRKIYVYSYLFTPILVATIIRAQKLSMSIEMRGFRAYESRTSYMILKMSYLDYFLIFLSFLLTALLVYVYVS